MVINTNIAAMASSRTLAKSTNSLSSSLARLSSGSKIVSPEDDAAGLAQSIRFDAQINRNHAVQSNLTNAISFSQTQDSFLIKAQSALDRMSELSVSSLDMTKTDTDRSNYSVEFVQLQNYLSDIGTKDFNGISIFADYHDYTDNNDPVGKEVTIDSDGTKIELNAVNYNSKTRFTPEHGYADDLHYQSKYGLYTAYGGYPYETGLYTAYGDAITADVMNDDSKRITISNTTSAASALSHVHTAIQHLADLRASVGSNIQRLKFSTDQVGILNENLTAANSRIKDTDVAEEATEYARNNILVQSGTSMLGQANLLPSMALQLLG